MELESVSMDHADASRVSLEKTAPQLFATRIVLDMENVSMDSVNATTNGLENHVMVRISLTKFDSYRTKVLQNQKSSKCSCTYSQC